MKWNNATKETLAYLFAVIALLSGIGLCVAGFIVDPTGEIHDSVLWVLGQCLTFVGAVCGISLHLDNTAKKIEAEIMEKVNKG